MIYSINYDLHRPGQNYTELYEAIKKLGDWWHYLESTWLVDTSLNANQIFQRLKPSLDSNDSVLIVKFGTDYSGWLTQDAWNWINSRTRAAA